MTHYEEGQHALDSFMKDNQIDACRSHINSVLQREAVPNLTTSITKYLTAVQLNAAAGTKPRGAITFLEQYDTDYVAAVTKYNGWTQAVKITIDDLMQKARGFL
jgi:hypothetical protein